MTLHLMEPELEELLHEIARDPRSTLLRVDRPTILRGLFDRDPMVRESCTQLTSAERQLLRVHRSELGRLLRALCLDLLIGRNAEVFYICTDLGCGKHSNEFRADVAMESLARVSEQGSGPRVRLAVARAVAANDPMCYAALACRTSPSTATYLSLSDSFELQHDTAKANLAIEHARRLGTCQSDQAFALSYEACSRLGSGDLWGARHRYREACRIGGAWPNDVMSWLALSVQCSDERSFSEAVETIGQVPILPATLHEWTNAISKLRAAGTWTPTSGATSFWISHEGTTNEQAQYVLQHLFSPEQ